MLLFSGFPLDELELALGDVLAPPPLGEPLHAAMSSATVPTTTRRAARTTFALVIIGALLHAGQATCRTNDILVIYRGPIYRLRISRVGAVFVYDFGCTALLARRWRAQLNSVFGNLCAMPKR